MKTISGNVTSTKPISLSKASKILSNFVTAETGASHAVSAYLKRASASFNELVQFHKELKASKSDRRLKNNVQDHPLKYEHNSEEEYEEDSVGKKHKKKKKKKKRKSEGVDDEEVVDSAEQSNSKNKKKKRKSEEADNEEVVDSAEQSNSKKKKKKRKSEEVDDEEVVDSAEQSNSKKKKKKKRRIEHDQYLAEEDRVIVTSCITSKTHSYLDIWMAGLDGRNLRWAEVVGVPEGTEVTISWGRGICVCVVIGKGKDEMEINIGINGYI
ncbi:unnamed protein product [Camellia sinensis]